MIESREYATRGLCLVILLAIGINATWTIMNYNAALRRFHPIALSPDSAYADTIAMIEKEWMRAKFSIIEAHVIKHDRAYGKALRKTDSVYIDLIRDYRIEQYLCRDRLHTPPSSIHDKTEIVVLPNGDTNIYSEAGKIEIKHLKEIKR